LASSTKQPEIGMVVSNPCTINGWQWATTVAVSALLGCFGIEHYYIAIINRQIIQYPLFIIKHFIFTHC
jgi:hypothetical protein